MESGKVEAIYDLSFQSSIYKIPSLLLKKKTLLMITSESDEVIV